MRSVQLNTLEKPKKNTGPKDPNKKHISKYWFVLLALVIVNAIVITFVLRWLYGTLVDFEATTPRRAIEGYFAELASGERDGLMRDAHFEPDGQSGWDDYFAQISERFGGVRADAVSWRQTMAAKLAEG
jgi:hypothetical protein